jgi:hypothetical protein
LQIIGEYCPRSRRISHFIDVTRKAGEAKNASDDSLAKTTTGKDKDYWSCEEKDSCASKDWEEVNLIRFSNSHTPTKDIWKSTKVVPKSKETFTIDIQETKAVSKDHLRKETFTIDIQETDFSSKSVDENLIIKNKKFNPIIGQEKEHSIKRKETFTSDMEETYLVCKSVDKSVIRKDKMCNPSVGQEKEHSIILSRSWPLPRYTEIKEEKVTCNLISPTKDQWSWGTYEDSRNSEENGQFNKSVEREDSRTKSTTSWESERNKNLMKFLFSRSPSLEEGELGCQAEKKVEDTLID